MLLSSILSLLEPLFSHYFVTLKFFATLLSWNKNIIIPRCEKVIKKASGPRRVGPDPKSCFEWPRTNVMGAGGHPEHFEPKQRSVAVSATQRTASKVLASQYWRPIFRGRNFGSKLKFYYANRCLGVQK